MADKCPCGVLYPSTGFAIDTLFCCCSDGGSDEGIVIAADADINDTPVVGATVLVKGKRTGTKTDTNGAFTITANKGDVLVISSVGYTTQQVTVDGNTIKVTLPLTESTLGEVVVTALGIKKERKALGYSVTDLGVEGINEKQEYQCN